MFTHLKLLYNPQTCICIVCAVEFEYPRENEYLIIV